MSENLAGPILLEQLKFCHSEIQRARRSIWLTAQLVLLGGLFTLMLSALFSFSLDWKVLLAGLPTLLFFYAVHDLLKTSYILRLERFYSRLEETAQGDAGKEPPSMSNAVFARLRCWPDPFTVATRALFVIFLLLFLLANIALWWHFGESSPRLVWMTLALSGLEFLLLGVILFQLLKEVKGESSPPPK